MMIKRNIRVAFVVDYPKYIGGINYINNLLEALKDYGQDNVSPHVFIGRNVSQDLKDLFSKNAEIVESSLFDRGSLSWILFKLKYKLFGKLGALQKLIEIYQIDVVSHSDICGDGLSFKTINWLPDFQFLLMPEMFSKFERFRRNSLYKKSLLHSDMLVVSSNNALEHLKSHYSLNSKKIGILRFVASVNPKVYEKSATLLKRDIESKYNISGKYFYCPNQFWKHKNHIVLLQACRILNSRGVFITVVFSGLENDFRHPNYFQSIKDYVTNNNIEENIKFLGIIPYADVQDLLRNCVSVVNPSLFEGWSTTVEEARSIGKNIVLSDLPIHREQNPPKCRFFSPSDSESLANILYENWFSYEDGPDISLEIDSKKMLSVQKKVFCETYLSFIECLFNDE